MYYSKTSLLQTKSNIDKSNRLTTMGKLFVMVLLIVIFEGALRKWISSSLTNPIILLRDTIAFYGIIWAVKTKHLNFTQLAPRILWLWSFIVIFWGLLQLIINNSPILIFFIGTRFWLLYLWFAYAAAVALTEADFHFIKKTLVIILFGMVGLATIQHFLPPSAFINKQIDDDVKNVFLLTKNIVRTTGTFSFTLGYTVFLSITTPFILAQWDTKTTVLKNKWLPTINLLILGIGTMISGSRAAIIFFLLFYSMYILISLRYSKDSKKIRTLLILAVMTTGLALVPFIFSRATKGTYERFKSAAQLENFSDRIATMFFGEPLVYEKLPSIGHGIGLGTNFAAVVKTGSRAFLLAETETARTLLEGGILGIAFIGLKLLVIVLGLKKSIFIIKLSGNSLPFLLWTTTSIALLSWPIIGNLTVNALGYLLFGLALASLRLCSPVQAISPFQKHSNRLKLT